MKQLQLALVVGVLYILVAFALRAQATVAIETAPVWLGSGVTFAALLVTERWKWPAVLAGATIASIVWGTVAHHLGFAGAVAFGLIEALSMGAAGLVANWGRRDAESPSGAGLLIAGALVGAISGAFLSIALWMWQRPDIDMPVEWRAWAFSTAVGLLLVAPVATAYRGFRIKRSGGMTMQTFLGGAVAYVGFIVAVLVIFSQNSEARFGGLAATLAYVPMPFLLIASLLWGSRGGSVATLVGSLLILYRTAHGGGPFAVREDFVGEAVVEVQGFILVWAGVLLITRSLSYGHRTALADARAWRLRYVRSLQAVGLASVEYDAHNGQAVWGNGAAQVLGPEIADVRTVGDWMDRINPSERGMVQAAWQAVASGDSANSEQEYGVRLSDGRKVQIHERLAAIRGGDDRVEHVAAILRLAPAQVAHG